MNIMRRTKIKSKKIPFFSEQKNIFTNKNFT